ncbi:hypothetical protein EDD29_7220 [Actinocorallia herbida]|uniref:Uncharacterized protein n=1 Tax=Actinocorallia herbida TaxID=58109 RepID=A0A3N1D7K7_9ACTN|nr:hypothetical protein [Actinocorallia herbida]ROO89523.1 hypothetical protein EDD29_7220 [Actinocorallia herbida]
MSTYVVYYRSHLPSAHLGSLRASWAGWTAEDDELGDGWRSAEFGGAPDAPADAVQRVSEETRWPALILAINAEAEVIVAFAHNPARGVTFPIYCGSEQAGRLGLTISEDDVDLGFREAVRWSEAAGLPASSAMLASVGYTFETDVHKLGAALLAGLGLPGYAGKDILEDSRIKAEIVLSPVLLARSPVPLRDLACARPWPGGLGGDEMGFKDGWRAACPVDWPRGDAIDHALAAFANETRGPTMLGLLADHGFGAFFATYRPGHHFEFHLGLDAAHEAGHLWGAANDENHPEVVRWAAAAGLRPDPQVLDIALHRRGGPGEEHALTLALFKGLGVPGTGRVDPHWDGTDQESGGRSRWGLSVTFEIGF